MGSNTSRSIFSKRTNYGTDEKSQSLLTTSKSDDRMGEEKTNFLPLLVSTLGQSAVQDGGLHSNVRLRFSKRTAQGQEKGLVMVASFIQQGQIYKDREVKKMIEGDLKDFKTWSKKYNPNGLYADNAKLQLVVFCLNCKASDADKELGLDGKNSDHNRLYDVVHFEDEKKIKHLFPGSQPPKSQLWLMHSDGTIKTRSLRKANLPKYMARNETQPSGIGLFFGFRSFLPEMNINRRKLMCKWLPQALYSIFICASYMGIAIVSWHDLDPDERRELVPNILLVLSLLCTLLSSLYWWSYITENWRRSYQEGKAIYPPDESLRWLEHPKRKYIAYFYIISNIALLSFMIMFHWQNFGEHLPAGAQLTAEEFFTSRPIWNLMTLFIVNLWFLYRAHKYTTLEAEIQKAKNQKLAKGVSQVPGPGSAATKFTFQAVFESFHYACFVLDPRVQEPKQIFGICDGNLRLLNTEEAKNLFSQLEESEEKRKRESMVEGLKTLDQILVQNRFTVWSGLWMVTVLKGIEWGYIEWQLELEDFPEEKWFIIIPFFCLLLSLGFITYATTIDNLRRAPTKEEVISVWVFFLSFLFFIVLRVFQWNSGELPVEFVFNVLFDCVELCVPLVCLRFRLCYFCLKRQKDKKYGAKEVAESIEDLLVFFVKSDDCAANENTLGRSSRSRPVTATDASRLSTGAGAWEAYERLSASQKAIFDSKLSNHRPSSPRSPGPVIE
jgi:hypothetical protein